MIRSCRYTGRGFNSHRFHHYGGVTDSTGMTMMESRLSGEATSQKLQTINWKRLCITNGCLIGSRGFIGCACQQKHPNLCSRWQSHNEHILKKVLGYHLWIMYPTKSNGSNV